MASLAVNVDHRSQRLSMASGFIEPGVADARVTVPVHIPSENKAHAEWVALSKHVQFEPWEESWSLRTLQSTTRELGTGLPWQEGGTNGELGASPQAWRHRVCRLLVRILPPDE